MIKPLIRWLINAADIRYDTASRGLKLARK
jgi:hypothetical protein